jgi:hypothetical protein
MERSHSSEANNNSASQITRRLWNVYVHYRVCKDSPLIPVLSQMNPLISTLLPEIYPNITFLHRPSSSEWHFPSGFTTNILHSFLPSMLHAHPSHPPWFYHPYNNFEAYKLRSSSLCSLLQPPKNSFLFDLDILLITLFSDTFNICPPISKRPSYKPLQNNRLVCNHHSTLSNNPEIQGFNLHPFENLKILPLWYLLLLRYGHNVLFKIRVSGLAKFII